MAKITREKFKTFGNVFDAFTERVLIKLINQGHFEGLQSPISIGKEANVFKALHEGGSRLVKIYRLESCDFNQMYTYIRADLRYQGLSGVRRKVIFAWTQREYRNLLKCRLGGVRVPTPHAFHMNVLVEDFIGEPAPKLKDLPPKKPEAFYKETVRQMKLMAKAGLVHGDLSSFNILNHLEKPVIIDMSQSTTYDSPQYQELLERDCRNISNYFSKIGVDTGKLLQDIESIRPKSERFKNRPKDSQEGGKK